MKVKLFILFFIFSFAIQSQEFTVFYKEKRVPAQVSIKESFDYSEVDLFYNRELAKINAARKRQKKINLRLFLLMTTLQY